MAKQTKRPTTSKERTITDLVEAGGIGDTVEEIYGPTRIAGSVVWELWVTDSNDLLATRFVEEFPDGTTSVYDTFQQLAVRLDIQQEAISKRLKDDEWTKTKEMAEIQSKNVQQTSKVTNERVTLLVPLLMGATGFAVAIAVFAIIALRGGSEGGWAALFMFGTIIASACTFIYGTTKYPNILKSLLGNA